MTSKSHRGGNSGRTSRHFNFTLGKDLKPRVVISGVNLVEAGPLSVFKDALREFARAFADRYEVIALVHSCDLFDIAGVTYMEFPSIKSSWIRRVRFEYWDCRALSRTLKPHLWIAMHDITPNVAAQIRAVYCHNPAPFYRMRPQEAFKDWRLTLFRLFYSFLYAINMQRNQYVVVQQEWLRGEFCRRYNAKSVIVAHPSIPKLFMSAAAPTATNSKRPKVFFYPAFPRSFKNAEAILKAALILETAGSDDFEVWLTMSGKENGYARNLFSQFGGLRNVRWLGLLPREEVMERYQTADFLVFPSKLETWGMPISEFQQTGKPILVADLPYAHETVGAYVPVRFFPAEDPVLLAQCMEDFMREDFHFDPTLSPAIASPYAPDWVTLFRILLNES